MFSPCKKNYDQPRGLIKKQRHYFSNKGLSSQGYGFSSSRIWMWELDYKESWALKNWCFWTVVLEKTLESPLDCKVIQPVHPIGDQSWDFFGRTDAKAETPVLWPLHAKSWLIGKDSDAGRDWGQQDKGMTEDLIVGWHHQLSAHGFGWTPGVGDGQGCLPCCGSWDCKESDTTERLNWTELILIQGLFFICGTSAYTCLPLKCKGKCSLGYIILSVNSVVRYSPIPHKTIHFWTRTWEVLDQWDLSSFLSSLS